ncbi:MAG: DUF1343 domain-containing protein [Undibacterium sp.]|nr:DUF1343 domain-containing protein [Opitutaceae bacterium]
MVENARVSPLKVLLTLFTATLGLLGCSASQPTRPAAPVAPLAVTPKPYFTPPRAEPAGRVMLGIDVLEADGFAAVKGKRIGLLTHPAGVNRNGLSTVEVLRRAPGVKLVALYAGEHGVYGEFPFEKKYPDHIDPRTGLMVYSLYSGVAYKGKSFKASPAQLKDIDALVVDLQDIGTRSYTFISAMKLALEACFENGKEIIILDRPNPLGGLKVDGPPLDAPWMSYVGAFRVPYVHGLTMGELARLARESHAPGGIDVTETQRAAGKLTIIPMRGWTRSMRWSETGLTWVATSNGIQDFAAVQGYPMTGLGTYLGGFRSGVGSQHIFRGISHKTVAREVIERELRALNLPGLQFRVISVPNARSGQPAIGLYAEISDYDAWRPTELSFQLMRLACKLEPKNPFTAAKVGEQNGFIRHMGSEAFMRALQRDGARVDLEFWLKQWREQARVYQELSKRYWLYK